MTLLGWFKANAQRGKIIRTSLMVVNSQGDWVTESERVDSYWYYSPMGNSTNSDLVVGEIGMNPVHFRGDHPVTPIYGGGAELELTDHMSYRFWKVQED